eukprot:TRINITY_DN24233_c0_g1_i1.p1 TRINITY_DN24233_c0_g1~~TRINITY_DN24233_c0_g1_i1.p1  ORF type:complete len:127 (+),score=16.79 TRINITY_DN24233_c0_g1_i1:30-410(+)
MWQALFLLGGCWNIVICLVGMLREKRFNSFLAGKHQRYTATEKVLMIFVGVFGIAYALSGLYLNRFHATLLVGGLLKLVVFVQFTVEYFTGKRPLGGFVVGIGDGIQGVLFVYFVLIAAGPGASWF